LMFFPSFFFFVSILLNSFFFHSLSISFPWLASSSSVFLFISSFSLYYRVSCFTFLNLALLWQSVLAIKVLF
jgi:hypothetical protein